MMPLKKLCDLLLPALLISACRSSGGSGKDMAASDISNAFTPSDGCGWQIPLETDAKALEAFEAQLKGAWINEANVGGFAPLFYSKVFEGRSVLTASGFTYNVEENQFGNFSYFFLEQSLESYMSATDLSEKAKIRPYVGKPWKNDSSYRPLELLDETTGDCTTYLIKRDGDELKIYNGSSREGAEPSIDEYTISPDGLGNTDPNVFVESSYPVITLEEWHLPAL